MENNNFIKLKEEEEYSKNKKRMAVNNAIQGIKFQSYLSFDKKRQTYYHNFYLNDFKLVYKIPLTKTPGAREDVLIEKFSLSNLVYLLPL